MDHKRMEVISAEVVIALARCCGYTFVDKETAARIAVGATNAVRAVENSVTESLFDSPQDAFLLELEELAEPD